VELRTTAMAAGGDAVARDESGRVVFVRGALPDETVRVQLVDERAKHARAVVEAVHEPSPFRREPPCPYVAAGCGGCGWQHVALEEQRRLKRGIVVEALERIGRVADADVVDGPELAATGFRTTVRMLVTRAGHLGYRRSRSHSPVAVDHCLVAHPRLQELMTSGRFPGAREVVLRCSAATGERVAVIDPARAIPTLPADVAVGPEATVHEEVAGHRLRISGRSFFQTRSDGAEALVVAVTAAAGDALGDARLLVDAYAGVGLFGACLSTEATVIAVESSGASCRDAIVNLEGRQATVVRSDVARWRADPAAGPADLVVADPPRTGLGRDAAARLAAAGAPSLVLVSCDPVAMARDAGLLRDLGYGLGPVTMVDLFPHTPHIETVARFHRT
jgi:23S rRNA (uracil1939-C5)-methyltransferase